MKVHPLLAPATLALAANLLLITPGALAESPEPGLGDRILESCRSVASGNAAAEGAACLDYIAGVSQTLRAMGTEAQEVALGPSFSGVCVPPDVGLEQMAAVFVEAADAHPDTYAQWGSKTDMPTLFMAVVFADRWPCAR